MDVAGGRTSGLRPLSRVAEVAEGWQSVRLDEIEPIPVAGGTLLWRPVRRTLDVGAFGINSYVAPSAGDDVVEEHTERLLQHEEVYIVLSGQTFTLDDETLDAPTGTVVFVRDPQSIVTPAPRSRRRQFSRSAARAVERTSRRAGSMRSRRRSTARPATTRRWPRRSAWGSSATPTIPDCSTTSRAPRRLQVIPRTLWLMLAARSTQAGLGGSREQGRGPQLAPRPSRLAPRRRLNIGRSPGVAEAALASEAGLLTRAVSSNVEPRRTVQLVRTSGEPAGSRRERRAGRRGGLRPPGATGVLRRQDGVTR